MIIDTATIKLSSQSSSTQFNRQSESLRQSPDPDERSAPSRDQVQISQAAQSLARIDSTQTTTTNDSINITDELNIQIIKRLYENITGHKFKLFAADHLDDQAAKLDASAPPPPPANAPGVTYERSNLYYEAESVSFSALGQITTKDGKNIDFSVKLNMTREFYQLSRQTLQIGGGAEKIDPLVINFNGTAAQLSSTKFEFDLDNNGSMEQIAHLKANSGYLALDKNNDGVINNGSELFGPQTGNGFQELSQYDDDNNGFIDEADAVYSKLRLWQRFEDGSQKLLSLGDKDIGAIYLGHVSTPFQLKGENNGSLGEIANTGVYIKESGETGTIQHINLSV